MNARANPTSRAADSIRRGSQRDTLPDERRQGPDVLADQVLDARRRTLELIEDLNDEQLLGPRLAIVNPLLWEIGHLGWFAERWVLRHANGRPPIGADVDALYDSSAVAHDARWDLPLPSLAETIGYLARVEEQILERLAQRPSREEIYFIRLSIFHEDMHDEAFLYTRQTLGYPPPRLAIASGSTRPPRGSRWDGDVTVAAEDFSLGAEPDESFVFDNEKWSHPSPLKPYSIARAPVTQEEFLAFVEEGGYRREELWCPAGWAWRERRGAQHPLYWRQESGSWLRRDFDRWVPLAPFLPVIHVNWYEADAFCRWSGRRLPTEAEWEAAASWPCSAQGPKRRFPWGAGEPTPDRANLDGRALGCVAVSSHAPGDSPCGCRQIIGNVWEWTADDFGPYPGFVPDPYKDYSAPWFGDHKVLRGGCWATRGRLLRNTWRNFYRPDRRDVFAGFRTCAL
jgi:iron(II)-dependent oxidoreductase